MFKKFKEYFTTEDSIFTAKEILVWLWAAWKGNRFQAVLNASLGLMAVAVSITSVWSLQNAIDIAAHSKPGNLYWAVGIMAILVLCNFAINISSVWVKNILGIKVRNRMQQRMLDYYGLEEITEEDVVHIHEDYIKARRAWIAEIRKDAEKEYQMGDVDKEVFDDFLEKLDHEVDYEN